MLFVYLAVGGAVGTVARYGLGGWVHGWAGAWLPWGTVAANLVGSFVLGVAIRATEVLAVSPEVRGLVTIGFCGAFTTFSTYSFETVALLQAGAWGRAALYAVGSLLLGLAALTAGLAAASVFTRTTG